MYRVHCVRRTLICHTITIYFALHQRKLECFNGCGQFKALSEISGNMASSFFGKNIGIKWVEVYCTQTNQGYGKVSKNITKDLFQVAYFIFGCGIFLVIPAYVFHLVEDWSYIDAVYFAIVSLTKIGFGDFVPNTQPPDKYAQVKQDKQKCLFLYLNPAPQPGNFHDEEKIACKPSQWSSLVTQLFAVYRVLVNFWMIIGLSFFGTLISIMANGINDVITKKAPSFLSNVVNMGNILHIINASAPEEDNACFKPENNMIKNELWSPSDGNCKDDEQLHSKEDEANILKVRNSKTNKWP